MGMEVEEDAIQDGQLYDIMARIDQEGQEDGAEKQQNQPQKKNNMVVETAFSVEDQTEVIIDQKVGGEWNGNGNGNGKEKGEIVGLRRSGRMKIVVDEEENLPCEQYKVGANEQYQPQNQCSFTWISRGEHIQGKGGCVKQRRSGSKQHVSEEPFQPCEQLEEGIKEKGHQRKQYNVVWIGRGVRKLEGAGKYLPESDEEVIELEDYVGEDAVMINCDAEVDEHVEQLKLKEEKGAINMEHNRPEENQQSDTVEKQFLDKEQLMSVIDDKVLPCEQHERVDTEVAEKLQLKHQRCNEVLPETLQVDDEVKEGQYLLMARSDEQEVGVIKEWIGKQKQGEGESMEQIGSQLQQNHLSGEQVDLQKQSKEENDCNFYTQGPPQRGSMEQDLLQKQDHRSGDEQNSVMMQCEVQVKDASVEKQHDDTVEEQIRPEEQPKKGTEEEQQNGGGTEQKMLEIQVQKVGKPLQDEEIKKGRVLTDEERDALVIQYEVQAGVENVEKTEAEEQHDCLTEEQVDTKEQSKEHDDVTEEPIHLQEKCIERTEEEIQSCGPDLLKNGEAESAEEQPQQEEQQTEVNQKEIGLVMDSEVQQDLRMNHGETEVGRAYVIQNESEERPNVAENHVLPQEHCMGGNKFQLHKQQQRDVMKQVHIEGEVEVAEDEHPEEQLNKVKEKDIVLMHGVSNCLQDLVMTQTEAEVEGDNEEHNKSEVYQGPLEKRETVTSQGQPQQEGQHKKLLQEESELMNNLTAVEQDFMMIESGSQLERTSADMIGSGSQLEMTSVEHNGVQEDDTVVGQVQPQKEVMEGTKEGQKGENEAGFEKNQSEECEDDVKVQRYQPQEQCVERTEERSQPCIQQTEASEKDAGQEENNAASNENVASSSSIIEVSGAFPCKSLGVAKVNLPDHKHQGEQRRPLRQGLRSSCKKEEATTKAKNQLERATPVRRSLRPRKTTSEATVVIENGPNRSKEQLKHSRRARPSKRKPGIAEAEQASKSQKTRRTDL
ncbi:hypothetical protein Ccrd_001672 [Cynara cardunculus var. scolymus]|uniref:Uncharacterized protein n=2 Tax=Cynara cardunculus var. scolymus TaxID=59895 RepID=A0A103XSU4_CYNCS|nr:hypothetical protein Ccrd_001672 [Cynara cardunculus var. scolymus]